MPPTNSWARSLAVFVDLRQTGNGMNLVLFRRLVLALICAALAGLVAAKPDSATPVPFRREARLAKRYASLPQPERAAVPVLLAKIEYPKEWRQWGQPARAVVSFVVKETGVTTDIQCIEATDRAFAKAAEKAVQISLFMPALKDQQGIASKVTCRIDFALGGSTWAPEAKEAVAPPAP